MLSFRCFTFSLLLGFIGCGGPNVPEVPRVVATELDPDDAALRSQQDEVVSVSHPPPAALPELVSEPPSEAAKWLDGYWNWEQNTWVWRRGGWVELEQGQRLLASRFWYGADGVLYFATRRWLGADGNVVEEPEIAAPAATPPTSRLAEEATVP